MRNYSLVVLFVCPLSFPQIFDFPCNINPEDPRENRRSPNGHEINAYPSLTPITCDLLVARGFRLAITFVLLVFARHIANTVRRKRSEFIERPPVWCCGPAGVTFIFPRGCTPLRPRMATLNIHSRARARARDAIYSAANRKSCRARTLSPSLERIFIQEPTRRCSPTIAFRIGGEVGGFEKGRPSLPVEGCGNPVTGEGFS